MPTLTRRFYGPEKVNSYLSGMLLDGEGFERTLGIGNLGYLRGVKRALAICREMLSDSSIIAEPLEGIKEMVPQLDSIVKDIEAGMRVTIWIVNDTEWEEIQKNKEA